MKHCATIGLGLLTAMTTVVEAQTVIFVDASAALEPHDGSDWCHAYLYLQEAVAAAESSDGAVTEIRIADGTYRPDEDSLHPNGTGDREASFRLLNDLAVKGGYAGCGAADPDERDIALFRTVLTGDLVGNDHPDDFPDGSSHYDNCDHVFNHPGDLGLGATALLDGVTITAASASGMRNVTSSPTVTQCTFLRNSGGGMYNTAESNPRVSDCTFRGNSALRGGGINNNHSNPALIRCAFTGNSATNSGGGLYSSYSSPTVASCTFSGNSAGAGGGMHSAYQSNPTLVNCTFSHNSAVESGGGTYGAAELTNCILWGNTADSEPQIGNPYSEPVVSYSCVQGGWPGDGNIDADPLFRDADGPDDIVGTDDDDLHLHRGSPCVNAGDNGAVAPGVAADIDGETRIQQCRVDMGADETRYYLDCNTNTSADACDIEEGASDDCNSNRVPDECDIDAGTSTDSDADGRPDECDGVRNVTQGTHHATIQLAIDSAVDEDEIEVGPGTYYECLDMLGKAVTLRSTDGPDATILDGDHTCSVITCASGEGRDTIIEGFTITNGEATDGGGMYVYASGPTVVDCVFAGNSAGESGGGVYSEESSPTLTNCMFNENFALYGGGMFNRESTPALVDCTFNINSADHGGGMRNLDSSPTLTNCDFGGNLAGLDGGGMSNSRSHPTLIRCTFSRNAASRHGGAMSNRVYSHPTLASCTLSGNSATEYGGGMFNSASRPEVGNCTLSGNAAGEDGGAIYGSAQLANCIVWGNTAPSNPQISDSDLTSTVIYSCVRGGWPGRGNIADDPLFVDADGGDEIVGTADDELTLRQGSPCINAGANDASPEYIATVEEWRIRIQHCRVDMGAHETPYYVDCNIDAVPDACEIEDSISADCNNNGVPDKCDIEAGTSTDADGNGRPDDCEPIYNSTQDTYHSAIQLAIYSAVGGDEIEVGPGTYHECIDMLGKAVTLRSTDGQDVTTIDGDQACSVITCASGEGPDTLIEGFTIVNGEAPRGGGMYVFASHPTVTRCKFSGNHANDYGGGMYNEEGSPTLIDCMFSENVAGRHGGGLYS